MMTPANAFAAFAAAVSILVAAYPAHGDEGRAGAPPAWYHERNDFLTRDGGVFHTDNSAYRSENEPWVAYGLEWEKGPSRQTLRGRLFGIHDGKDAGTFWDFHVFWHPGEGKAFISQVGADGTLGMGILEPPGADGAARSEATMYFVDGTTTRIAHVVRNHGDIHATESFDRVDGAWQPRRSYVWRRVVAETGIAAGNGGRAGSEGKRGRLVDVGGRRLFLDCVGSGSPTVVIDGGAATWSIFYRHIQDEVARDTRVCTYDRAGYGDSDDGPAPRAAGALADDLHRLLQAAGERTPYVLVGHSLGGYIVRIYRQRHPSEVAAIVLVESGHPEQWTRLPSQVRESVRDAVPGFLAAAEAAKAGQITAEQLDPWAFQRHGSEHRQTYERAMLTPKPWLASAAEFEAAEAGAAQVPKGDLGDLPVVVVTAGRSFDAFVGSEIPIEESNPVWLELQRELVGLSTASEHILSPDANHNIEQSDPAAFVDGIRRAISTVRGD